MRKQKGIVLFFALIVLLLMTIIGVALAVNSTQSIRMSGAGAERIEAKSIADGGLQQVILKYEGMLLANLNVATTEKLFNGVQQLTPYPLTGVRNVACQRTANATGANLVNCRRVEISSTRTFGRDDLGQLTVVSGVEQQVLP
ncbi:pilus assembly PilX N-terminal domain-containing protein [Shewanella xiamenensis]|uniref:pilus assembly PilX family protein n=1 Tax=Shewanella TaxID=22 RepID=UPI001469C4CF|nr:MULTISPECIES: pilus assembly PilX N-terminal domain-containing protein [Shewanella]MCT8860241.1 pilus assembly PilX N-terminal domain-containing protein [Shewanella xiamenensis]MDN5500837.1 pilus assembly PilX N-terminal domain-containing protein [Shewanella sp.]MDN5527762.1 pilus assembly PilX N-terminal domain-containing protein [Shewanella sp.]NMD52641.1 pilus assembly protein PilX [Shewanella sp. DNRA4]UWG63740.1 pilus assembly PilX N-terminal domain-containing protein [Shewanella xiame